MGFSDIPPVERTKFFLDLAFRRAKERADQIRGKKRA